MLLHINVQKKIHMASNFPLTDFMMRPINFSFCNAEIPTYIQHYYTLLSTRIFSTIIIYQPTLSVIAIYRGSEHFAKHICTV